MAAAPTGWSRPGFVTLPTPSPPSMTRPSGIFSARAQISAPSVASQSSPPSFRTPQKAAPPSRDSFSGSAVTAVPSGAVTVYVRARSPLSSSRQAAPAASAAHVPVV